MLLRVAPSALQCGSTGGRCVDLVRPSLRVWLPALAGGFNCQRSRSFRGELDVSLSVERRSGTRAHGAGEAPSAKDFPLNCHVGCGAQLKCCKHLHKWKWARTWVVLAGQAYRPICPPRCWARFCGPRFLCRGPGIAKSCVVCGAQC